VTAYRPVRGFSTTPADPWRFRALLAVGWTAFALLLPLGDESDLWFPALGVGLTLVSWFGFGFAPVLAVTLFGYRIMTGSAPGESLLDATLIGCEMAAGWWVYSRIARGSRWLEDPRSAVLFLILVPGLVDLSAAAIQTFWTTAIDPAAGFSHRFGTLWISRSLGVLVLVPFLWVVVTPLCQRFRFLDDVKPKPFSIHEWTLGEFFELAGLVFGNGLLALIQLVLHRRQEFAVWPMWGLALLLVVWSSIRQGLRGGAATAFAGCVVALLLATFTHTGPGEFSPLQGNLLSQCSTALLVGSAVGWIRLSEAKYQQVVGHIPLVLTSVRLVRGGVSLLPRAVSERTRTTDRPDLRRGPEFVRDAELILVSQMAMTLYGVEPVDMLGPYERWLDLINPDDRLLAIAAIAQMGLQRQSVTYEFRVAAALDVPTRWMRETLSPHYSPEGLLDGWDGVAEDITVQRTLQQENRRITGMLQSLVANMPTGVFFVQAPVGQPILVNARARQLLGQREDAAAGLVHLSKVYRLHRADGTEYPTDELPVAKALKLGIASTASDMIVHRPDGRRVPLFTWAAPVYLNGNTKPDAAVWVMEDLSSLQQAEFARREGEARLRAVFETLTEGVLVQNQQGVIVEANPAATALLGVPLERLVGRSWLVPDAGCLLADGSPCPVEEQPDRRSIATKAPVRGFTIGLHKPEGRVLWLLVNSVPLPVGTAFSPNTKGARILTTFADITKEHEAIEAVRTQAQG
jgi:PAS domain S-box-containing protein